MHLSRLKVENLRVLASVDVRPGPSLNFIFGANGSGKTSFLEAVYLLGQGRSFRSRLAQDIISRDQSRLVVFAELFDAQGHTQSLGIEKTARESRYRSAGAGVQSASHLARLVPMLLITPDSYRILTDGGRLRRRMLDWALFHVEPTYNATLQKYRLALRQRNAQLRGRPDRKALRAWAEEMGAMADELHRFRERYAVAVREPLDRLVGGLLGREVQVSYRPGWDTEQELADVLSSSSDADAARGYTAAGPHRADIRFIVDGRPAQNVLSRGEGKLFVAAVLLTQTRYVATRNLDEPVVLVDDLASELDAENRHRLAEVLRGSQTQVFVTATDRAAFDCAQWPVKTMFHVERGSVEEVV